MSSPPWLSTLCHSNTLLSSTRKTTNPVVSLVAHYQNQLRPQRCVFSVVLVLVPVKSLPWHRHKTTRSRKRGTSAMSSSFPPLRTPIEDHSFSRYRASSLLSFAG